MKVVILFENRTVSKEYKNKHGLSLYIETSRHKVLFDTGTDDTFAYNADKLGINLEDIDTAIISHGHYDHGGGIETFLKLNKKAKIYIGRSAFDKHLLKTLGVFKYNIGLKKELSSNNRFIFVDEIIEIDDELILFSNVKGNILIPPGNKKLLKKYSDGVREDNFKHEINLLINEKNRSTLFCGCAHRGITNIIQRAIEIVKRNLNSVVGGFHLMGMNLEKSEYYLNKLSKELSNKDVTTYYTCHCTGEVAYKYLSQRMNNLNDLKTGMVIEV